MAYEFSLDNLRKNVDDPKIIRTFWITIAIAAFFAGIFISSQYYQDKCNSYILDYYTEPNSKFKQDNPTFNDISIPDFNITVQNETRLSPIKQLGARFKG